MRLFSKLVFICNVCFVIAVILRLIELAKRAKGNYDAAISLQPIESTIIILGYGAIFINFVFFVFCVYWLYTGKIKLLGSISNFKSNPFPLDGGLPNNKLPNSEQPWPEAPAAEIRSPNLKPNRPFPRWIVLVNLLLFPVQVWYFFFSKI